VIIGGTAVAYYGFQRVSGGGQGLPQILHDIDFWYNPTTSNYYNLLDGLKEIGVDTARLEEVIFDPNSTYLRIPHGSFKMEFLPQMVGLDSFSICLDRSSQVVVDGNNIKIIGYQDLIKNKKAVDREVDKTDIEELKKIRRDDEPLK